MNVVPKFMFCLPQLLCGCGEVKMAQCTVLLLVCIGVSHQHRTWAGTTRSRSRTDDLVVSRFVNLGKEQDKVMNLTKAELAS